MLTTTLDGLWVLQVLAGVEVLAPELGLRPHLPSAEAKQAALAHPVAAELRAAGAISGDVVDQPVLEWLTVLARRDVALLLYAQREAGTEPDRVLLCRFAQWWVALERCGTTVRLSAAGTANTETSAALVIRSQIERLCGVRPPAVLRPVVLRTESLLTAARSGSGLGSVLAEHGLDGDQVDAVTLAADSGRCTRVSLVALQSGAGRTADRSFIDSAAVTIHDTPRGRLVSEQLTRDGTAWSVLAPGSTRNIAAAVNAMMRRLPAREHWHSHRKVV